MKVVLVAPTYLPARRANTIQVMKMAQALVSIGHEVQVLAPDPHPSVPSSEDEREWHNLAHLYGLQLKIPINWLPANQLLRRYDYAVRSVYWAKKWKADLIYTRLPQTAALASITGQATVLEIHDLPQGLCGPWILNLFLKGHGARNLVVISKALANDLYIKFPSLDFKRFLVIAPDGVDLARYDNLPEVSHARESLIKDLDLSGKELLAKSLASATFIAGYTGHLYPGRGMELLQALAAKLPLITFLIVGGEPHQVEQYRADISNKKIFNMVITGFIDNADLPLYQAACDVLLMPYQSHVSASSGGDIARYLSPMKLFEYMASGRAILSSELPVLQEVLSPLNSILLPPDNVDSWAKAICTLQKDKEYRNKLARQAKIDAQQYSWEDRAKIILKGIP
jgi:glycosyltransferase involved in cell wall biosynthesis